MKAPGILFAFILFLVLDGAFLYLNRVIFQHQIIDVQRVALIPKYLGAGITYIILFFGFYYFILRTNRPFWEAALLGGVVNGVYEFTNYTLLKKWRMTTALIDTTWGATLWGLTAYITYQLFPKTG
jgi:uncharacterized membrane protein